MGEDELKDIETKALAATPGPWMAGEDMKYALVWHRSGIVCRTGLNDQQRVHEDAAFIDAADPSVVLRLIAEVRRLQAIEAAAWRFSVLQAEYDKAVHAEHDISEETLLEIGLDHAQAVAELIASLTP